MDMLAGTIAQIEQTLITAEASADQFETLIGQSTDVMQLQMLALLRGHVQLLSHVVMVCSMLDLVRNGQEIPLVPEQ